MSSLAEPKAAPFTNTPLHVLMVAVRYYPFMGGVESHTYEVSRRLVAQGVKVTILTANPAGKLPAAEESAEGVRIVRVRTWPNMRDFALSAAAYRFIQQGDWDVVHCQGYHTLFAPMAMLAAARAHLPYIVSFHSGGHSSGLRNSLRSIQRRFLRPLLARADRLIGVSQFEAAFFQAKLRLPAEKFVVIPNGSQLPRLETSETPQADQSAGKLIVSVGRLERYKGHHRVLAALPKVLESYPETRLRIVGSGPYEANLQQMAHDLGVAQRVEIGPVPPTDRQAMTRTLSEASLMTLMSEYEAHPIAVMEALSLQRPVLVANTSGLQELADRGLVRSIALESSTDEVAQAIIRQLEQPLVPALINLPTWEACTASLLELYQSIAEKKRAITCAS